MKIFLLNAIQTGVDTFEYLRGRIPLAGFIGLSDRWDHDGTSGYLNARDLCAHCQLPYFEVDSYGLRDEADRRLLLDLEIDVLIVAGWQRLIPEWLIEHVGLCCVGAHGSPLGITRGRGRSPQNWALLLGLPTFDISIFKITPGIDSGAVIASRSFSLEPADTIRTSYIKASYWVSQMIVEAYQQDLFRQPGQPQNEAEAEYLPQRTAADGLLDWNRAPEEIANFVRALTRPYPGAFALLQEEKFVVWSATPFPMDDRQDEGRNGEVIHRFCGGELLVRCGGGAVIITDYETAHPPNSWRGVTLDGGSYSAQIEAILARHHEKYPTQRVSSLLERTSS